MDHVVFQLSNLPDRTRTASMGEEIENVVAFAALGLELKHILLLLVFLLYLSIIIVVLLLFSW